MRPLGLEVREGVCGRHSGVKEPLVLNAPTNTPLLLRYPVELPLSFRYPLALFPPSSFFSGVSCFFLHLYRSHSRPSLATSAVVR